MLLNKFLQKIVFIDKMAVKSGLAYISFDFVRNELFCLLLGEAPSNKMAL
ncbi:hypothetical protein [Paenibacillus sp. NAIST15-1]|nr:hypothetical protein [Paenibacillus sp. NAIST15-1]